MNQLLDTSRSLPPHIALTSRIIRTEPLIRAYLRWFAAPESCGKIPLAADSSLVKLINSLIESTKLEGSQACNTPQDCNSSQDCDAEWLASAITFIFRTNRYQSSLRPVWLNLLAACLLPLYRAGFAENLSGRTNVESDPVSHTRYLLKQLLLLAEVVHQLKLTDLLSGKINSRFPPQSILGQALDIDLSRLCHSTDSLVFQFDENLEDFDRLVTEEVESPAITDRTALSRSSSNWDSVESLWQIACEMNSQNPEMILPRNWLQPPIDWNQTIQHWRSLKRQLLLDDVHAEAETGDKLVIGEVVDFQDTAFLTAVRTLIALGRSERRSLCLSLIEIAWNRDEFCNDLNSAAELHNDRQELCRYRHELAGWFVQHAGWQSPHIFVTANCQIVLAVADCDRQEMAALLRSGLSELKNSDRVMQPVPPADAQPTHTPSFHVGIASTPVPSANLDAEDIVESASRCLKAAKRMGREAIKSIEVY